MISDPVTVTVGAEPYVLARINQDNYTADYFDVSADGLTKTTLHLAHTIPGKAGATESHLCRLDSEVYDSSGVLLRTNSVWVVFKVANGSQVSSELANMFAGLATALQASSNALMLQILGRQS